MTGGTGCLGLKTFGGGSSGSGVETAEASQRIQSEKRAWNCVVCAKIKLEGLLSQRLNRGAIYYYAFPSKFRIEKGKLKSVFTKASTAFGYNILFNSVNTATCRVSSYTLSPHSGMV